MIASKTTIAPNALLTPPPALTLPNPLPPTSFGPAIKILEIPDFGPLVLLLKMLVFGFLSGS